MREGWKEKRLGEICELYQPKTISKKEMVAEGKYPVFGANGIIGRYSQYNHDDPQLIITCRGATCGSVNVSFPKSWITGNAMVVRPINLDLDLRYLEYFCRGGIDFSKVITGAAQPQLTRKSLSPVIVSYPPLSEQKRIVAILDEAFEGIDTVVANTEQNFANTHEIFESYRDGIFDAQVEGWHSVELGELCTIKHGFAFKSEFFTTQGDYIVLTPGSFWEHGGFRDQGKKTKYYEGEIPDGYLLEKGDFLFAMTEQAAGLLGSSLVVPESHRYLHNQRLGLVQPKDGDAWHNDFFFHQFNTPKFRSAVQATASGAKVRHTSPKKLCAIPVVYPPSTKEQAQVASKLNGLWEEAQRLEAIYQQKLTALAELKQSLLQKAFSGELTAERAEAAVEEVTA